MSNASPLEFDEAPRCGTVGGANGQGATEQIARFLQSSGVDVPGSLYDEALHLAREGRLGPATERLRMLLTLDPSDGEAALLLGKVLATRGLWQESLTQLDAAATQGVRVPGELREEVEVQLRRSVQDIEGQRARLMASAQTQMRTLRNETKRLRAENAMLEQQGEELSRRVKVWSNTAALIAGCSAALLLGAMIFGGRAPSSSELAASAIESAPSAAAMPVAAPGAVPGQISAIPVGDPAVEAAPAEPVPAEAKPAEAKPAEAKPAEAKPAEAKPAKPKPAAKPTPGSTHTVAKGDTLGKLAQRY